MQGIYVARLRSSFPPLGATVKFPDGFFLKFRSAVRVPPFLWCDFDSFTRLSRQSFYPRFALVFFLADSPFCILVHFEKRVFRVVRWSFFSHRDSTLLSIPAMRSARRGLVARLVS